MTGKFNIATILVPIGLLFIGVIFLSVGMNGGRIMAWIFGGLCAAAAIASTIGLIISAFKQKKEDTPH